MSYVAGPPAPLTCTVSTSIVSSTPIRAQTPKKTTIVPHPQGRIPTTTVTRTVLGPHPRYSYQTVGGIRSPMPIQPLQQRQVRQATPAQTPITSVAGQTRKFITSAGTQGIPGSDIVVLNPNQSPQIGNKTPVQTAARYVNFPSATKVVGGATNVVTLTPKTLQSFQGVYVYNIYVIPKIPIYHCLLAFAYE